MSKRSRSGRAGAVTALLFLAVAAARSAMPADVQPGERVLANGIELPPEWPPHGRATLPRDPEMPPYLQSPPKVIRIDVGRQLFVDDFLIETTTLRRTYHRPTYHQDNPVLKPDRPWEGTGSTNPCAMVFSDGVFVNANAARGALRAEILDEGGRPIEPFTLSRCDPIGADGTKLAVVWRGATDVDSLAGRPVRFRFELRDGSPR